MLEQLARAGEAAGAEAVAQAMAGAATLHIGATTSPSKAGRPLPRSAAPSWTGDLGLGSAAPDQAVVLGFVRSWGFGGELEGPIGAFLAAEYGRRSPLFWAGQAAEPVLM